MFTGFCPLPALACRICLSAMPAMSAVAVMPVMAMMPGVEIRYRHRNDRRIGSLGIVVILRWAVGNDRAPGQPGKQQPDERKSAKIVLMARHDRLLPIKQRQVDPGECRCIRHLPFVTSMRPVQPGRRKAIKNPHLRGFEGCCWSSSYLFLVGRALSNSC